MSQRKTYEKVCYSSFDGIDVRNSYSGEKNIFDIVNFRISETGALVKRKGFEPISNYSSGSEISAVWGGILNGIYACYYIVENTLYKLDISRKYSSYVGSLPYGSQNQKFFFFKDSLYVYCSSGFFKVSENSLAAVLGYVPLYGKEWGTGLAGEINEPLNIINGYARISYVVPQSYSTTLATGRPVKSVLAVYKNGTLLSSDKYSADPITYGIAVPGIKTGDKLLVTYEFYLDEEKQQLFNNTQLDVFGGINNCRLFLWGCNNKNLMYATSFVEKEDLQESERLFADKSALYFPLGKEFTVGDGRYAIKAISRHYDRLLIFTQGDTWMADAADCARDIIPVMNINSSIGCSSDMGVSTAFNDPVTIWQNDIYRWNSDTDELNECNAYSIANKLDTWLPSNFFKNGKVFKDIYRNELWFYIPNSNSDIFIYNVSKKAWVRFSGISASMFFDADGDVGFCRNEYIYKFSNSYCDTSSSSISNIDASLTIKNLNFGSTQKKKLSKLIVHGESDYGQINMTFIPDDCARESISFMQDAEHSQKEIRLHSNRFRILKEVRLSASGNERQTIRNLELYVR